MVGSCDFVCLYLYDVRRMDAADDVDEDELLDYDVQMSIQESLQREHVTVSERYRDMNQLHQPHQSLTSIYII